MELLRPGRFIYIHTVSRPKSTKLCDVQLIILSLLYNHPSQASDIFTAYNFEYDILERSQNHFDMELQLPDIIQARKRAYIKSTIGLCCSTVNTIIETYQTSTTGLHSFHFRRPDILSYTNKQQIHIQVTRDLLMITGNI